MPIEILMPALSPTMTEGNLAKWLKKEGDEVHSGDVLAEIETDKATMEFEAVDDGRLGKILVPEGAQGIKVNQPIAVLLGEGEDASALEKFAASRAQTCADSAAPAEHRRSRARAGSVNRSPARDGSGNGRIFASPLARRMAQQAGLDLAAITRLGAAGPHRQGRYRSGAFCRTGRGARSDAAHPRSAATRSRLSRAGCAACSVQGAGAGARRQSALHRAAAHRDAPRHRPAADRIEADRPAFLSDGRLRDRRAVEDSAPSSTRNPTPTGFRSTIS